MGIIARHAGAPFQDGETLSGADLEADIATAYDAINGNIDTVNLKDSGVTTAKIADGSVTQAKLDGTLVATVADNGVTTAKIVDLAVTTAKIAASAVTTAKIADANITQAKVATGAVMSVQSSFGHSPVTLTTSFAQIAASVHPTGTVATRVVVTASFTLTGAFASGRSIEYTVEKGGVSLLGSGNVDTADFPNISTTAQCQITRTYVDESPTSGSSHTYRLMVRYQGGVTAAPTIKDVVWVVNEPRN